MTKVAKEDLLKLYCGMLRIRLIEERIALLYPQGKMRTPTHFSIGQEAVSVGVCHALREDDFVFATHRCHAAYLAKGGSLKEMLAELYGRLGGAARGRAGSAHLAAAEKHMFASPILAQMIPIATGVALSFAMDKVRRVSTVFFGDAAVEEGACPESINFALIKKLPVLFVCENNLYSTHTHIRFRQPKRPIYKRMSGLGIAAALIDGNDAIKVYQTASEMIRLLRSGKGPFFLECTTYRFREHVGPNFDFNNPYRSKKEVEAWMGKCPIKRLESVLSAKGILTGKKIANFRRAINRQIDQALDYAENSPWPKPKDMFCDVY